MAYKEYPKNNRYSVQQFYGIRDKERIGDGWWQDMRDMTADEYPVAMVRAPRALTAFYDAPTLIGWGAADSGYSPETGSYVFAAVPQSTQTPQTPFAIRFKNGGDELRLTVTKVTNKVVMDTAALELACEFHINQHVSYATAKAFVLRQGTTADIPTKAMLPGRAVDAVVVDGQMIVATDAGYLAGDNILYVGQGLRQIARIGRQIYTNTGVLTDDGLTAAQQTLINIAGAATVTLCDADSVDITVQTTVPATPSDGNYYYDTVKQGLYRYSELLGEWVGVPACYTKLTFTGTAPDLSGIEEGDALRGMIWETYSTDEFLRFDGAALVRAADNTGHVLILNTMLTNMIEDQVRVELRRRMPVLDYICEHDNRVFGCRYGLNDEGEFVNEIYVSALGKPARWFSYEGISSDSFTVSVGEPGAWTGCCSCGDVVFFFKENKIFVMAGGAPGSYSLHDYDGYGVQAGSEKSLTVIENAAYYKSSHGVRRIIPYSYPVVIGDDLGEDKWTDAIGGTDGRKYYISMADGEERSLYVYDTDARLWTREAEPDGLCLMIPYKNNLLAVGCDRNTTLCGVELVYDDVKSAAAKTTSPTTWYGKHIYTQLILGLKLSELMTLMSAQSVDALVTALEASSAMFIKAEKTYCADVDYTYINSDRTTDVRPVGNVYALSDNVLVKTALAAELETEPAFAWYAESGLMELSWPNETRVRIIQIRAKTADRFRVRIMYDDDGEWHELRDENRGHKGSYRVAFTPARRCDTFRLRYDGTGAAVIYSADVLTEDAGDFV